MELGEYLPVLQKTNAPVRRRRRRGGARARLGGAGARLPGLAAGRPGPAPGRGAALLGLGGAHPGRRTRPAYPSPPQHPDDELLGWLAAQHAELETALAGADPAERVWTWAPQQDVAFVLRRQVQEAVVHTVDVEQVLGDVRPDPDRRRPGRPRRVAGGHGARRRCRTARRRARTRWCSTPWTPTPSAPSSPAARPFPIAALTGTAGDLLLTVWRRVPLEVLTVDGDGLQAAAMIDLVHERHSA